MDQRLSALASENASNFEFRDIQAFSASAAVILSIGEGNLSRIYQTSDGGVNWKNTFVNDNAAAFYDCMAFEKRMGRQGHGVAMSDPVDGKFRLLETWDGGAHWSVVSNSSMPAALPGSLALQRVARALRLRRAGGMSLQAEWILDVSSTPTRRMA
ncbi:uncharacterized protein PtrM4_154650 [Pyrenophora tritici-repentis]|uniref:Uncharacterized protein n=1 Tax=Pyrenophora tritici-repentis TaxID=45151 RepID=A0A316ZKW3_9PLEO|nr:hypothetical protein PtrM4_154650 [Pyrenophora tritici-repentis]